jgi:hypothetical protein
MLSIPDAVLYVTITPELVEKSNVALLVLVV